MPQARRGAFRELEPACSLIHEQARLILDWRQTKIGRSVALGPPSARFSPLMKWVRISKQIGLSKLDFYLTIGGNISICLVRGNDETVRFWDVATAYPRHAPFAYVRPVTAEEVSRQAAAFSTLSAAASQALGHADVHRAIDLIDKARYIPGYASSKETLHLRAGSEREAQGRGCGQDSACGRFRGALA